MQPLHVTLLTLHFIHGSGGFFSTIECPVYSHSEIFDFDDFQPSECTLVMSHDGKTCKMKDKVSSPKNVDFQSFEENPCQNIQDSSSTDLLPFPGNCSLFYKCDWGSTVVFECPPELHFNSQLQACDWPWQAQCDFPRIECPRPYPQCPSNFLKPLYLSHPHLCDHFYQCEWGIPRLRTCPTGLHFSPVHKICDWPYKAHCQVC